MSLQFGVISSQEWSLPVAVAMDAKPLSELNVSWAEIERRARAATYEWLASQFDEESGAFYGHFRVPDGYLEPPQTVNLIAPWQALAAYDRYQDSAFLTMATRAAEWFYERHVVDHPMSVVAGGVRDGVAADQIWTKFSAEEVITCLGVYSRTHEPVWLERAQQSGRYLIQARRHGFAPRFALDATMWLASGWDSWGRVVEANLLLWDVLDDSSWLEEAVLWGEHGLGIQHEDGSFYLIDGEYYNTDLAADELRAL